MTGRVAYPLFSECCIFVTSNDLLPLPTLVVVGGMRGPCRAPPDFMKKQVWYLPRPSSHYPGSYPLHFEKRIPELLGTIHYIHLFSGSAKTGHTVDIKEELNPDTIANAENLPFPDNHFNGGFADPPYNKLFAKKLYNCKYPKWSLWTKELVRVVRPGGKIGIMQNYIVPRLESCTIIEIIIVLTRIKQFPRIVTIQQKNKGKQTRLETYIL